MKTSASSHSRLTTFRRLMVIFAVILVLSSVFPAGKVEAAVTSYIYTTRIDCMNDGFRYQFTSAGQYYDQLIAYRFSVYKVSTTGSYVLLKSLPSSTGYFYTRAKLVGDFAVYGSLLATHGYSAPNNTYIQVRTTAYYWDNVNRRWVGPVTGAMESHFTHNSQLPGIYCLTY